MFFNSDCKRRKIAILEKKKKKVMIDGIQLEDTLCTRNCRTRIMVINCECGLKTSIDNDFSARIKKIKKTVC